MAKQAKKRVRKAAMDKVLFVRADGALVRALQTLKQERARLRGMSMADVVRTLLWEAVESNGKRLS